jgi:hypothetical protein
MWSDFADRCKIKGTMRLLIASKQTNGGSVLLAAELWKRVADNRAGLAARSQPAARKLKTTVKWRLRLARRERPRRSAEK